MKICIIGNSHVGALKRAWEKHFDWAETKKVSITFFAARGRKLNRLKYKDGMLIAKTEQLKKMLSFTSGGESFIDLNAYDVLLLYGLGTAPYYANDLFYSEAVIGDFIKEYSSTSSLALKILRLIPQDLGKKIYIGHDPMGAGKSRANRLLDECANNDYERGISLVNNRIFNPHGAKLLGQPSQTIAASGRNTISTYSKGSKRLAAGAANDTRLHPETDSSHMNESFGEAWLDHFLLHIANDQ